MDFFNPRVCDFIDSTFTHIRTKDGTSIISFDVPGFSKDDVKVTVDGNRMRVSGKKTVNGEERSVDARFIIPDEFNALKCRPAVSDGVLTVTLAKQEADSRVLRVE